MEKEKFEKYNLQRNKILSKYKNKKIKESFSILGTAAVLVLALSVCHALIEFPNIAVTLVLCAVITMISIIFTRIRIVTANHNRDKELRLFEDNDPTFY